MRNKLFQKDYIIMVLFVVSLFSLTWIMLWLVAIISGNC